jgi:hypothetical protein
VTSSPLAPFLHDGGVLVLDGGLATELERADFDLDHPLWSARLLSERPEAITAVHRAYLEAGADCITSASYQATAFGFRRARATAAEAIGLLWRSVELALAARDAFGSGASASSDTGRGRPSWSRGRTFWPARPSRPRSRRARSPCCSATSATRGPG